MDKIKVNCKSADTLPIDTILEFQGPLKKLTTANRDKLMASILKHGFIAPLFVWDDQGDYRLLDGHQRLATLIHMRQKGYDIPMLPVDYIQADSEDDAKRKLLQITSQYGDFTTEGFQAFTEGLDFDFDEIRLTDGEFKFKEEEKENQYTKKIEAPIYEPKGEMPNLSELYDDSHSKKLIQKIEKMDIPEEEKLFLINAAMRHTIFQYDKIAEYYCHATPEVQQAMEEMALIIIDFDKAIELGFVELSEKIEDQYRKDYGNA